MHGSPPLRGTPSRRGKSPRFAGDLHSPAGPSAGPGQRANGHTKAFFSSLDIPVQGAIPIDADSPREPGSTQTAPIPPSDTKRAPRKSKTEALAALNNQARSSSTPPDEADTPEDLAELYRNASPIPVSPRLDLSTVKTQADRPPKGYPRSPRPFGLSDCPEFYPTVEEFKDPMAYIKSIAAEGSQYGICKIVPPDDWSMPFVTDTKAFRFKTRLQRLNNIEASSRAKITFLEQLYCFHKQQGNPRVVIPTINHKPLDLWLLRKEVHKLGGYDAVCKAKKWSDLGRLLGYRGVPGLSTQIKNSYTRVILPFEHFVERSRNSTAFAALTRDASSKTPSKPKTTEDTTPPASPLSARSSPLSEPPDDSESKDANGKPASRRRSTRMGGLEQVKKSIQVSPLQPPTFYDRQETTKGGIAEVRASLQGDKKSSPTIDRTQQSCEICHKKNRETEMLLCDGCDCGFHMFCLDPPLDSIPKDQWFCFSCLSGTGGDFGFDEGEEHSLSSFQARDNEFRRLWWERHPPPNQPQSPSIEDFTATRIGNVTVTEGDVEREFWRLVQSDTETVEIEYGADVHSTTHGSAMPTLETHPLDPYSKDPWNLNNIPILPDSLLRYIKSDISGMTVPWTYVGMTFSTFCWHNEDHYTYSINYMHWGETKTWYGIPGSDAEKFEAAIKCEAPDLFEAQPDLLFQLVTLMNPELVANAGVQVYGCNQRAGEFVITFPKAYHAGFNHGLNFNEAVNFALPDWLPFGRDCAQRYRLYRKMPVFSHDELIVTITQQSQSIKTAMWLIDSLKEMTERELGDREQARALGVAEVIQDEDRPEEQNQCHICKAFCYLSQLTCPCSNKVVCVNHAALLCDHDPRGHATLRKRLTDQELNETLKWFTTRASQPAQWQTKLTNSLATTSRPALRTLRALLAEGERIAYPLPEMTNLRKCVGKANEWVDSANSFLIRKQSRKRSRKSKGRQSLADGGHHSFDDPGDRPDRSLDDLYALLKEVETLGFDCDEIDRLKELGERAEETRDKAKALLAFTPTEQERPQYLAQCRALLLSGSSLNVVLDELTEVEKIVDQEQLITELSEKMDDGDVTLTLEEVRQYLSRARQCNLPSENKYMKMLDARQREGNDWETRARNLLDQRVKTIAELNEFATMDSNIPIDHTVLSRLMAARTKALDYEKQAAAWLACEPNGAKARIQDVMRLTGRAMKDFDILPIKLLRRNAEFAEELEVKCESVLRGQPIREKDDVFEAISGWSDYAQKHLSMFALSNLEKLQTQLLLHQEWVKDIPWFCKDHNATHSKEVLEDVIQSTRPDEDAAPTDEYFTCICNHPVRPPPNGGPSDAVQCDHCYARFHGECAKNGGSCPFCDFQHWNGSIPKQRNYHFCFLPSLLSKAPEISRNYSQDFKQLEIIVHRVDRLCTVIGHFLTYTSMPEHQLLEYIPQVRHYMRKLYRIQFAVSPNPDVSFGLDLAGLHRILAGRPALTKPKKRKRPRFTFGPDFDPEAKDGSQCLCRGRVTPRQPIAVVGCEMCNRLYHMICVFFPPDKMSNPKPVFTCPLCCLRKNRPYPYSEIRVKPPHDSKDPDMFVDVKEMMDTFSKTLILRKMPTSFLQGILLELVSFQPGSDGSTVTGPAPRAQQAGPSMPPPQQLYPPRPPSHHVFPPHHPAHSHPTPPASNAQIPSSSTASGSQQLPTPPWARWGTVATPSMPPATQKRLPKGPESIHGAIPPPPGLPNRKRKYHDEHSPTDSLDKDDMYGSSFPLKRHAGPDLTPTPTSPPRPAQTLSPSLAMIVSPTNQEVHTSPRTATQLPPLRNGPNSSPRLPPVKTLMGSENPSRPL